MEYIYTGETTSIGSADGLSLIVIANQLCLPHLVCKTEAFVASELQRMADPIEETIMLIEPSKVIKLSFLFTVILTPSTLNV